jgi:hypothetical protein
MDSEALDCLADSLEPGQEIVGVVGGVPIIENTGWQPSPEGFDPGLESSYYDDDYVDW